MLEKGVQLDVYLYEPIDTDIDIDMDIDIDIFIDSALFNINTKTS